MPLLRAAPPWTNPINRYVTLWHGCTAADQVAIQSRGVDPLVGNPDTDFGRGFYTTTIKRQACFWAWTRFYNPQFSHSTGIQPVVLRFRVDRHKLARLSCLNFVCADFNSQDFWSLVQHCRRSTPLSAPPPRTVNDHAGPIVYHGSWYDIACGPVAAFWQQRSAMHDADQISFHTRRACRLLTDLIKSQKPGDYQSELVT